MRRLIAVLGAALAACTDPAQIDNPFFNTHLGRTTGLFPAYRAQDYLCELLELDGETNFTWTLYRDVEHQDLTVRLPAIPRVHERFQRRGTFQFKVSDANAADSYGVYEQGTPKEDVRPHSVPTKYIPVVVHHLRVPAKPKLCDTLSDDCIEVPESEIFDSTFWCEDMRTRSP